MLGLLWVFAFSACVLASSAAQALDYTTPHLRVGASAGLFGTLPVGDDVDPEFEPGLWVHVDAISMDIGEYAQLNAFFRLTVAGSYDTGPLAELLGQGNRLPMEEPDVDNSVGPNFRSKEALVGLSSRIFPFGAGLIRPFLSLGAGFATAGARFNSLPQAAAGEDVAGRDPMPEGSAFRKQGFGAFGSRAEDTTRRHMGLGLTFGLGVRFDPKIPAFGEQWVLPVLVELSYVKNVWLGLSRTPDYIWRDATDPNFGTDDPPLLPDMGDLPGKRMKVDFLGLLVTFGFLR